MYTPTDTNLIGRGVHTTCREFKYSKTFIFVSLRLKLQLTKGYTFDTDGYDGTMIRELWSILVFDRVDEIKRKYRGTIFIGGFYCYSFKMNEETTRGGVVVNYELSNSRNWRVENRNDP